MIGLSIGTSALFQPARAKPATRYMVASNRFGIATDWGIPTVSYAAGSPTGINGGSGTTQYYKKNCKRYLFSTGAWAPKAGRFLWTNAQMDVNGIFQGLFNITIDKVQVRSAAGVLIETIKFSGATSRVLGPGEALWSDPGADLAANTSYFLDVYWTAVDNGAWPAQPYFHLRGEKSTSHASADLAGTDRLTTLTEGFTSSALGGMFGPNMFAAKGWDGISPCVLIVGDSIADYTRMCADFANARGDLGFIQQALGDASGGVMTWTTAARWSSYSPSVFQDGATGSSALGLIDWLANACAQIGSQSPFTAVIDEHGRNNMGTPLATQKGYLANTLAKIRARFGSGVKYFKTTTTPNTTASGNTGWTDEASQTASGANAAGGVLQQWNDWLKAGADGQIAGCFDVAAAVRSTSDYGKWAVRPFSSTLLDAVSANAVSTIRLADAPAPGETLAIEPGSANADIGGLCVYSVTANGGGGYDVVLHADNRMCNAGTPTSAVQKVAKAHAAGTTVRAIVTQDGLHPGNWGQLQMRDVIIAAKAVLAV